MEKRREQLANKSKEANSQYGGPQPPQTIAPTIVNTVSMGPGRGLYNWRNTCYMNSILQCLARIPDFSSYLASDEFRTNDARKTHKVDLVRELANVFSKIRTSSDEPFNCCPFKFVLGQACPLFANFDQQDAHQFLVQLFGVMNGVLHQQVVANEWGSDMYSTPSEKAWADYKRRFNTKITDLFGGLQSSSLKCKLCHFRSDVYSPFVTLSLPLPNENCSLQDCFAKFCRGNTVSGWNCPKCQKPIDAESSYGITKLPKVLVIHLQRFEFTGYGWRKSQITVDFPVSDADLHSIAGCDTTEEKSRVYDLYAVCNHWGTLQYGHYYAYGRGSVSPPWYEYNDTVVSQIPEDHSVLNREAAYLLFYVAREKSKANNQKPEMPVSGSSATKSKPPNGPEKPSRSKHTGVGTSEQQKMVQSKAKGLQPCSSPFKQGARSKAPPLQDDRYSQEQSGSSSNRGSDSEGNKRKDRNDSSGVRGALQDPACPTSVQHNRTRRSTSQ